MRTETQSDDLASFMNWCTHHRDFRPIGFDRGQFRAMVAAYEEIIRLRAVVEALSIAFNPSKWTPKMESAWYSHMENMAVAFRELEAAATDNIRIPESIEQEPSQCQQRLRKAGKPYPRTCAKCGLGPCQESTVLL